MQHGLSVPGYLDLILVNWIFDLDNTESLKTIPNTSQTKVTFSGAAVLPVPKENTKVHYYQWQNWTI